MILAHNSGLVQGSGRPTLRLVHPPTQAQIREQQDRYATGYSDGSRFFTNEYDDLDYEAGYRHGYIDRLESDRQSQEAYRAGLYLGREGEDLAFPDSIHSTLYSDFERGHGRGLREYHRHLDEQEAKWELDQQVGQVYASTITDQDMYPAGCPS